MAFSKKIPLLVIMLGIVCLVWVKAGSCSQPQQINFQGLQFRFPSSVKDAYEAYKLSFISPGHYFRKFPDGWALWLDYEYHVGDYFNESQPVENHFSRRVDAYRFRALFNQTVFDSVKQSFEKEYHRPFMPHTDTTTLGDKNPNQKFIKTLPNQGIFHWHILKVDSSLSICMRSGKWFSRDSTMELSFLYRQSAAETRQMMVQF